MNKIWRRDLENCPINKRIHFLCDYSGNGTLHEIVGTLTANPYTASITKGLCLEGDPNIFYKSGIVAWATYVTTEEAEALY